MRADDPKVQVFCAEEKEGKEEKEKNVHQTRNGQRRGGGGRGKKTRSGCAKRGGQWSVGQRVGEGVERRGVDDE